MAHSSSVFRPQWFLPLFGGWFWPGLRISEIECLSQRWSFAYDTTIGRLYPLLDSLLIC
jgi:hypothetical protein